MELTLDHRRVLRSAIAISVVLFALHLLRTFWRHYGDGPGLPFLNLGRDAGLGTWFAAAFLGAAGLLLLLRGRLAGPAGEPRWPWFGLGGALVFMSIDEVAALHEWAGGERWFGRTEGFFFYQWIILGIAATVLAAVLFMRHILRQEPWTRNAFLLGGALLVFGAIVIEAFNARLHEREGDVRSLRQQLQTGTEELFEFLGASLILAASVRAVTIVAPVLVFSMTEREVSAGSGS